MGLVWIGGSDRSFSLLVGQGCCPTLSKLPG